MYEHYRPHSGNATEPVRLRPLREGVVSDLTERLRRLMTNAPSCTNARIAAFEAADALEAAEAELARLEHQLQQAEEAATAAYKDAESAEKALEAAEAKLAAIDALHEHCTCEDDHCIECQDSWPCPTWLILHPEENQ